MSVLVPPSLSDDPLGYGKSNKEAADSMVKYYQAFYGVSELDAKMAILAGKPPEPAEGSEAAKEKANAPAKPEGNGLFQKLGRFFGGINKG